MNRLLKIGEVLLMVALLFVLAGTMPPDVNEAHYLAKAKSYWNPDWCARDPFLGSRDAHVAFFWTIGWLTRYLSLPAVAWIGRALGWCLLAIGWWSLSTAIVPRRGYALLSLAIATSLWSFAHMAGEWVVGGVEAKVFSYGFVFLALGAQLRGKRGGAILSLGAAVALHPIVGGWATLACVWAEVSEARPVGLQAAASLLPWILVATATAAVGVLPALALTRTSPELAGQANQTYVFTRLPHHLLVQSMQPALIARFVVLVVIWYVLRARTRFSARNHQLQRFADFSVAIAIAGATLCVISPLAPNLAAGWLKYYCFRLSDIAVPMATAMLLTELISRLSAEASASRDPQTTTLHGVTLTAVVGLAVFATMAVFLDHRRDPRPGADRQGQMLSAAEPSAAAHRLADWRSMCDWARQFTPPDSLFLTPTYSQTFKWYAQRAEMATWKDVPQDAEALVEWNKNRGQIHGTGVYDWESALDTAALDKFLADHRIDYVIAVREFGDLRWRMPIAYQNESFRVYRVRHGAAN